jgi:hypothetical protein
LVSQKVARLIPFLLALSISFLGRFFCINISSTQMERPIAFFCFCFPSLIYFFLQILSLFFFFSFVLRGIRKNKDDVEFHLSTKRDFTLYNSDKLLLVFILNRRKNNNNRTQKEGNVYP